MALLPIYLPQGQNRTHALYWPCGCWRLRTGALGSWRWRRQGDDDEGSGGVHIGVEGKLMMTLEPSLPPTL